MSGYWCWDSFFCLVKAKARVSVPIRPMYMSKISTNLAAQFHPAGAPVERPQVVKPEVVSNITSISGTSGCTTAIRKQEEKMKMSDIITMVLARSTMENGIVR